VNSNPVEIGGGCALGVSYLSKTSHGGSGDCVSNRRKSIYVAGASVRITAAPDKLNVCGFIRTA